MRKPLLLTVAVVIVTTIGCAKSDSPADVVAQFLEAVRVGNSESASTKLTPLALERIKENDMDFAPPASETAQFRVDKVEMFESDKAFVESIWIERDADGQNFEETMTWGLRLTGEGWRISGMAAHRGPDLPPILVDFENPGQLMGTPATPLPSQGDGISRQARQSSQDPFQQTPTR